MNVAQTDVHVLPGSHSTGRQSSSYSQTCEKSMRFATSLSHETQQHPLGYRTSIANTTNGALPLPFFIFPRANTLKKVTSPIPWNLTW
jgi:hypothetical protein